MRRQRGMVLVVTLAVMAGLVAIMGAIAATQRVNLKAQSHRMQERRARLAAEAGIQNALAEIQLLLDQAEPTVYPGQDWALFGNTGAESFLVGNGAFRIEIKDAAGFINLNNATQAQLQRLPLTTEQIDSLLDWRTGGQTPRAEGAKDDYYNSLENPYNAKLRRLDSIDELLLVKGFTPATVYQLPTEQSSVDLVQGNPEDQPILADIVTVDSNSPEAQGAQPKQNVNTATLQQLIQRGISPQVAAQILQRRNTGGTFTGLGDVLRVQGVDQSSATAIVDNLNVGGQTTQGKINVNTAGEAVLNSIPNMQPDITSNILGRQSTGFTALSELLSVPGVTVAVMADMIDLISLTSQTFLVRVIGTAGDSRVSLLATITIQNNQPRVLKVEQMPFTNMWSRWGWEEETTSETVLAEAQ